MRELWIGALRRSDGAATARRLFDSAATASNNTEPLERPAKREALDRYLNARLHVDAANLELNGRRALTDFSSAARLEPQWVDAYAGLCEALVLDNVRTGDAARLVEAEAECARALRLDANNLEARRAQAYLDRKRGQLDAAQRGFEQVLRDAPDNVDAMIGLAEVHITQFARGSDALLLDQAKSLLRRAEQIDPAFWKLPFTLARALYAGQDTRAAIASNRKAVDLDPNILALSNLGTYQFCAGDLTAARAAYEQARRSDPAAFVGSGQLGVIAYFQRDYTAAVAHLRHAIDLHEAGGKAGDHRLWSNYADALRRRGDREAALNAYSQAVTLAERDAAGGDGNPAHQSYLAFYYEMLARLDPERWSARRVSTAKLRELASSNDIFSLMYIASVHFQRGETEVANAIKSRAAGGCPGFAMSPDLQLR
jgi:tetratricopeptide (TPR) repeat protein